MLQAKTPVAMRAQVAARPARTLAVQVRAAQQRAWDRHPPLSGSGASSKRSTPPTTLPFPFQVPFSGAAMSQPLAQPHDRAFKSSGKTVVITGGSQGIGRATALLFARKGYNVVVCARNAQNLQYVADDCIKVSGRAGSALAIPCDVTDEAQVRNMARTVMARFDSVDVLVNNAGVMAKGAFNEVPPAEVDRLMRTNMLGAYTVTQAFLPQLQKDAARKHGMDRPSVIMVNSFSGKVPIKHMSAFSASKFALLGLTEAIKAEFTPLHIHVASVHPGVVKSNHMERTSFYGKDEAAERNSYRQAVRALPISQKPEDVADAIFNCAASKSGDVVVGAPFAAVEVAYKATGINPLALPFAFL